MSAEISQGFNPTHNFNSIPFAILNDKSKIVFYNQLFISLLKPKKADLKQNTFSDSINWTKFIEKRKFQQKLTNVQKSGIISEFIAEISIGKKDSRKISFSILPINSMKVSAKGILLIANEVNSLTISKQEDHNLFTPGFYFLLKCDKDLIIRDISYEIKDSPKNLSSKIVGEKIDSLFPEAIATKIHKTVARAPGANSIQTYDYDLFQDEKRLFTTVRIFYFEKDIIINFSDVTKEKLRENKLKTFIEELHYNKIKSDQYANELALANRKLNESQQELKELNANKDKFFSIVAHDLKSPFNSLLGFSQFILTEFEELSSDEIKQFINNILKQSKHIFSLLENLLEWSRMQLGRLEFNPNYFNLKEQLPEIINNFEIIALRKQIDIQFKSKGSLTVFADKNMVETIIRNLISNSIKFTKNGGKVEVSASSDSNFITIRVEDNGVGIKKDKLGILFNIEDNHSTTGTNEEKGTGLGLILCKEFVESNGGKISVQSTEGKGTTFKFTLPKQEAKIDSSESGSKKSLKKTSTYRFSK